MDRQAIEYSDALKEIGEYPYVYTVETGRIQLLPSGCSDGINWKGCEEVRFFSDTAEIFFFRQDDEWKAVKIRDTQEKDYITRSYKLARGYASSSGASKVLVREYFDFDEDGQAFVTSTRLAGLLMEG